jgi:hypothetical protein
MFGLYFGTADVAGGWEAQRPRCHHPEAVKRVDVVNGRKSYVGSLFFTHWSLEVPTVCAACGAREVFTMDYGFRGSERRQGRFTGGWDFVTMDVAMTYDDVIAVYNRVAELDGRRFHIANSNSKDWANMFWRHLGGRDQSHQF